MKIAFLIANSGISGGVNVVLEHAGFLSDSHEVTIIVTDYSHPWPAKWHQNWAKVRWASIDDVSGRFDIVILTWWATCYYLERVSAGQVVFFNQSVESRFFPDGVGKYAAELLYLMGTHVVTEATWIVDYLRSNYSVVARLARNGIRKEFFGIDGPTVEARQEGELRILVEGPLEIDFKNVQRSIDLAVKSKAGQVWLLTQSDVKAPISGVDRVFSRVPTGEVGAIYRSCDVLLKLSTIEGMFGPPLEMFHCGGTAIVFNVSGHDEYIVDGANALVAPLGDFDAVEELLLKLKGDRNLLQGLKSEAIRTASKWLDWGFASRRFSEALCEIAGTESQNFTEVVRRFRLLTTFERWVRIESANLVDRELTEIKSSRTWRLALFLKSIFNGIAPRDSYRRRIVAKMLSRKAKAS